MIVILSRMKRGMFVSVGFWRGNRYKGLLSGLMPLFGYYLCANNIQPMPVYAITTSPPEFGKPPYQSIYLYESTDFKYDSEGNAIRCGEMLLRLRPEENTIQLASVECNCSEVKGHCFEYLLSILIREGCYGTELFGQQLSLQTKIELFIYPSNIPEGITFEKASKKLYNLYNKYGFNIETHENPSFLITTLRDIESNLNRVPYYSPSRTTLRSAPSRNTKSRPFQKAYSNRTGKRRQQRKRQRMFAAVKINLSDTFHRM
jgi:hypothetical protein